jgi:hypothetical protein
MGKTMEKNVDIKEIFPLHALTSCDKMACCYVYGVGERNDIESVKGWITFTHTT